MQKRARVRRLPVGAEPQPGGGVHFRVWAPDHRRVEVVLEDAARSFEMAPEAGGYFAVHVAEAQAGTRYRYRLGDRPPLPDPASRFQPDGPHGASQVVDPGAYRWSDAGWKGRSLRGQVIYELHIGTFTREGTWAAATEQLQPLVDLGVTVLELMPVAEFPGRFGWGYDGVDLFAPTRLYGSPDEMRRFVDRAHALGLAVILDVVYNHLGPSGNYLKSYAADYFTDRYSNEWGEPINFDGPRSGPVREFFVANAGYWIDEFHIDGLRLDATQAMHDASPEHVLAAMVRRAREAAPGRTVLVIGENEPQHTQLLRAPERGGYGFDALWNDDFHHTARVAATGQREAYYTDYGGTPQELLSCIKWGYLFQGQHYRWQKKRRGTPTFDASPEQFVTYLQDHDQVANSAFGLRLHQLTSPGRYRALTALWLLAPQTPMLFMGQEFAASAPFLYFADHEPELSRLVRKGRAAFLAQFPSIASAEVSTQLADPGEPTTFERSKLDHSERKRNAWALALHKDLLALRRSDPAFSAQRPRAVDGAVLCPDALLLRFFEPGGEDRLLVVNLGRDLDAGSIPEPLIAPPPACRWRLRWSSQEPRYGGRGTPEVERDDGFHVPGETAVVLAPEHLPEGGHA